MNNSYKSVMFVIADDWSRIAKCYGNDVIRTPTSMPSQNAVSCLITPSVQVRLVL